MKDTVQLTQLELVLLQLVEKGKGKWSWYELANALSRRDVTREPDMMTVLKNLCQRGLVKRYVEKESPRDRWELTSKGEVLLNIDNINLKQLMTNCKKMGLKFWENSLKV